ncbi:LytTR family DNA-binding domain-containing protein [Sphingobacterium sp. UDSM-2020]|uniref:LytTR family DNA-binding domain-containing protein n=1 Tax=Sphingobacterium sp. UDSM-2020 TaxID=2795738 RepID=UPI001938E0C4|nr:LytTR family DNA-binding domain-containing protein [Sphingobacterium sp. UDSM-2020]QQD13172.1 LytTR family transcriptional regulator [Sphingobacterium sp. UDSM-2020]
MKLSTLYPESRSGKEIILTSSLVGILFYILLIVYQPFGTSQFEHTFKYLLLAPYAIITTFSFYIVNILSMQWKKKWTTGREILKIFFILFIISIFAYFYNTLFLSRVRLSCENFLYMFAYSVAIGTPVSCIYILAKYIYLSNNSQFNEEAGNLENDNIADTDHCLAIERSLKLCIISENSNIFMEIAVEDFVFAEAADNYCVLHFYENDILKNEIIRISLTKLLDQIQRDNIRKVHRSLIVNLKKVIKFKGNTSGYSITLENMNKELRVSRNYISSVAPLLKKFAIRP